MGGLLHLVQRPNVTSFQVITKWISVVQAWNSDSRRRNFRFWGFIFGEPLVDRLQNNSVSEYCCHEYSPKFGWKYEEKKLRKRRLRYRVGRVAKNHHRQVTTFAECRSPVSNTGKFDRGLTHLIHSELYWLDVPQRILHKLGVTVHRCL